MVKMGWLSLKQKPFRVSVIILLALIVLSPMVAIHPASAQTNGYYYKSFSWDYNGRHWNWNLTIPQDLYNAYKAVPVSTRTRDGPAGYGFCTTTKDSYIQNLAMELNSTANQQGYNSYDKVSFVLAFVQSLPYTSDNVTEGYNEYPRFPIETLVDGGGDCEDTSILFATLTLIMGYGTVYINPPNHYAVGILGNDIQGTSWTYPKGSNNTYYYCETTGDGFTIGQLPDEFQGQSAYIYPIDEAKQFVPQGLTLTTPAPSPTYSGLGNQPTPIQNGQPTPTGSASSNGPGPSAQNPMPLSFNLIEDNPLLFIIIAFAIVVSIVLTIWSVRKTKNIPQEQTPVSPEPVTPQAPSTDSEPNKFCIFCGSSNKTYAAYCEKCGKQIGQQSA